jgi:hypothetical protein
MSTSVLAMLSARWDALGTLTMSGTASTVPVSGSSQTETLGKHLKIIMLNEKRAHQISGNNFRQKHMYSGRKITPSFVDRYKYTRGRGEKGREAIAHTER